jgi:asparagine synthase (glutamine-hydrolysing)
MAVGGPGLACFFDGVIHNGREIAAILQLDHVPDAATIMLAGYQRWGLGVLNRVAGDFTWALWDGQDRRLMLARDAFGNHPLHYWQEGDRLLFASEPRVLMTDPAVPHELDEERLAHHLTLLPYDGPCSFYRTINRIRPGHVMVVEPDGRVREQRWWRPEAVPPLCLARDTDYEEALRTALDEAVRCRLPPTGLVAGHLSGGLDSGSIMASAALMLAKQGRRITALTAAPTLGSPLDTTFKNYDEADQARQVAACYPNMDHVVLRPQGPQSELALAEAHIAGAGFPSPLFGHMAWWDGIHAEVRRRGGTMLLTGNVGNATITDQGRLALAGHLRSGRLGLLARELRASRRRGKSWKSLIWESTGPLLPPALRLHILRITGRNNGSTFTYSPASTPFLEEMGLGRQHVDQLLASWYAMDGADAQSSRLRRIKLVDRGLYCNFVRRRHGVALVSPATDRRLAELAFAIPDAQYRKDGVSRSLIRRAMADRLPPDVVNEEHWGHQGADWHLRMSAERALYKEELARLERSPLARRCLDLPRLRRTLEEWPESPQGIPSEKLDHFRYVLGRGLATGRFLRTFERTND